MKSDYVRNPTRSYKLIIQYIVAEVDSKRRVSFASGTGTCDVAATVTHQGKCPNQGVHRNDGYDFIGTYNENRFKYK